MNSYFASVEQQANPFLRGKAIGIIGKHPTKSWDDSDTSKPTQTTVPPRSVITTASIEAKALGVKTAMSTWEAKKICPSLILWPGDPHKYSEITERFNRIFHEFTPNVEVFSVDESFLDITEEAGDYFAATFIAQAIRQRLREECGERITASIGIAPNKLMAKLASEKVKPNGLTVAQPDDLIALLDSSELDDLCGIGGHIKYRLNQLGIETFKQLREFPLDNLQSEFKRYGSWLHEAAHGRDSSVIISPLSKPGRAGSGFAGGGLRGVADYAATPKSYGHSYTLPSDTHDPLVIKRYLLGLADKVGWRMRRDGFAAKRITAIVRFGDFTSVAKQHAFKEPVSDGLKLFTMTWSVIRKSLLNTNSEPIRLIGLSVSNLCTEPAQQSLFQKDRKMRSALYALDTLQERYGAGVWKRASTIPVTFKARSSGFHFDHLV